MSRSWLTAITQTHVKVRVIDTFEFSGDVHVTSVALTLGVQSKLSSGLATCPDE